MIWINYCNFFYIAFIALHISYEFDFIAIFSYCFISCYAFFITEQMFKSWTIRLDLDFSNLMSYDYEDSSEYPLHRIFDIRLSANFSEIERTRRVLTIRSLNSHIVSISVPDATQARVFRRIAEGFGYNVNNIRVTSTHPIVDSKHNEALTTFRVHYM